MLNNKVKEVSSPWGFQEKGIVQKTAVQTDDIEQICLSGLDSVDNLTGKKLVLIKTRCAEVKIHMIRKFDNLE